MYKIAVYIMVSNYSIRSCVIYTSKMNIKMMFGKECVSTEANQIF